MRALLVDIGNSRIKWAWLKGERLGKAQAADYSGWRARDFARRVIGSRLDIERILVSNVAADEVSAALAAGARLAGAPEPERVTTQRRACGVTVGYVDPWRLGVDRLLAMIAAHCRFAGRPILTVAVGTAMTLDLVGADGRHWGGAIIPAPTAHGREPARRHERNSPSRAGRRQRTGTLRFSGARPGRRWSRGLALPPRRRWIGLSAKPALWSSTRRARSDRRRCVRTSALIHSSSLLVPDLVLEGLAAWSVGV